MHKSGLTERVQVASILGHLPSDDELTTRARSILRWKIRYNSVRVVAQNGHVILSGNVRGLFILIMVRRTKSS
jgi:osmotically-inducible protein OsmY